MQALSHLLNSVKASKAVSLQCVMSFLCWLAVANSHTQMGHHSKELPCRIVVIFYAQVHFWSTAVVLYYSVILWRRAITFLPHRYVCRLLFLYWLWCGPALRQGFVLVVYVFSLFWVLIMQDQAEEDKKNEQTHQTSATKKHHNSVYWENFHSVLA